MALEVAIRKKAGSFYLNVDFSVEEEVFTLLGASGCGKSMTLKCIAGIETPDEGRIVLNGQVLFDSEKKINLPPQKRHVGYMFQDYALFQNMTVEENIMAGMQEVKKPERKKQVYSYIKNFHLEGLESQYPHELSGGQKQRLAMARMMASKPQVILLDEPFAALDTHLKNQMISEMGQELSDRNCPVLFVTHNRDEAFALSHRICAISKGSVDCVQDKLAFFAHPKTQTAAILSGCKNISDVEIENRNTEGMTLIAKKWNLKMNLSHVSEEVSGLGIRAHDLQPSESETDAVRFHCVSHRMEEALFEWDVYLMFEGAMEEFLWKVPKTKSGEHEKPNVPEYFTVLPEYVLLFE